MSAVRQAYEEISAAKLNETIKGVARGYRSICPLCDFVHVAPNPTNPTALCPYCIRVLS